MGVYEDVMEAIAEIEEMRRGKTLVIHPDHEAVAREMVVKANAERVGLGWEPWKLIVSKHLPDGQALIFRDPDPGSMS